MWIKMKNGTLLNTNLIVAISYKPADEVRESCIVINTAADRDVTIPCTQEEYNSIETDLLEEGNC